MGCGLEASPLSAAEAPVALDLVFKSKRCVEPSLAISQLQFFL